MTVDKGTVDLASVLANIFEFAKFVVIKDVENCKYNKQAGQNICKPAWRLSIVEF